MATAKHKIKRPVRVTEDQIALVLAAIADIEMWDAEHETISLDSEGGWQIKRVNGIRVPCPSDKLLDKLKGMH